MASSIDVLDEAPARASDVQSQNGKPALPIEVGEVHSLGGSQPTTPLVWVRCQKREDTVSLETCRKCPEHSALGFGPDGRVRAVHCRFETDEEGAQRGRSGQIRVSRRSVGDLMTRNVLCVRPDLSLEAVAEVFLEHGYSALPVTSDEGQLLGMVTEADVTLRVQLDGAQRACVRDAMQPLRCAVLENVPASQAAGILAHEGLERLVVVRPDGLVVGVLSCADLLAWVARADGYALPGPGTGLP